MRPTSPRSDVQSFPSGMKSSSGRQPISMASRTFWSTPRNGGNSGSSIKKRSLPTRTPRSKFCRYCSPKRPNTSRVFSTTNRSASSLPIPTVRPSPSIARRGTFCNCPRTARSGHRSPNSFQKRNAHAFPNCSLPQTKRTAGCLPSCSSSRSKAGGHASSK